MSNHNERNQRPKQGSGSHNRSYSQNAEYGRKGGIVRAKKGFATLDPATLKEISIRGGKARQEKYARTLQAEIRGHTRPEATQVKQEA